jgi:D-beta-D-heptose 7-phosphate kinase/D-beta-D-heptose 1-phosphate adenosyltransferase
MISNRAVVNGCFDLFHAGHEEILHYALRMCHHGAVLVLVNSNDSVRKLKGEDRPIDDVSVRIQKIKDCKRDWCLKYREYPALIISVFDTEEELAHKIYEFEPDMIIKGSDYNDILEITGSDDWPVLIYPRKKNISTSKIIKEQDD